MGQNGEPYPGTGRLKGGLGEAGIEGAPVVDDEHDALARSFGARHQLVDQGWNEVGGDALGLVSEEEVVVEVVERTHYPHPNVLAGCGQHQPTAAQAPEGACHR